MIQRKRADGSFDLNAALTEAEACYRQLTDGIQPYAEEKKANYTIKNMDKGKWVRLAKLTAERPRPFSRRSRGAQLRHG